MKPSVVITRHRDRIKEGLIDALMIIGGSAIFALGVDAFEIPNGLAAGGVTGLATIIAAVADSMGFVVPVGMQTIVMNALLMGLVVRTGDRGYVIRTVAGIIACGVLTDVLAPFIPVMQGTPDLLLCSLWGGVITGVGLGLVFRTGGNTGGTDILAQVLSKHTGIAVGTSVILVDAGIIALSAPVFSVRQALYAAVAMFVAGKVIDAVVAGPRAERAAYIISNEYEAITHEILHTLERGCTQLEARGAWSGQERPVLFCVLGRSEVIRLKRIVADVDPNAIVIISEVHEVFGEGFRQISG